MGERKATSAESLICSDIDTLPQALCPHVACQASARTESFAIGSAK